MKLTLTKVNSSTLIVTNERDYTAMRHIPVGGTFEADIPVAKGRVKGHHAKMFAFFNFCFAHFQHEPSGDEAHDFNSFRKGLVKSAGFVDQIFDIDNPGHFTVEARSLKFDKMKQPEFEKCYNECINAALRTVFKHNYGENIRNTLMGFF